MYGSQTGNSEDIALTLSGRVSEELGIEHIECGPLNNVKKQIEVLKNSASLFVIVCSTTGNGDAPENASGFWRAIKLRSLPKDTFQGMKYCVLGLGDTNYDKFCHMGKSLDARFADLGGLRVLPLGCADEATGLEEIVDPWMDSCIEVIQRTLCSGIDEKA